MAINKKDFETIVEICKRAEALSVSAGERITLIMDLQNVHDTIGLNLDGLLAADEFNFTHDIVGIQRHINRDTKELEGFFVPRYARQYSDFQQLVDKAAEASKTSVVGDRSVKDSDEKDLG